MLMTGENRGKDGCQPVLYLKMKFVPHSKHTESRLVNQILCRDIIVIPSKIHTKHTNTLCGRKVEILNVKPGVI
jgi:hypothetical protein